MKSKITIISFSLLLCLVLFSSCSKKTYTVSFDSDGGTEIADQQIENKGTVTKPSNPTKEGCEFLGWFVNGKEFDFNTIIENHLVIKAKWEVLEYTVSFVTNTEQTIKSKTVEYGDKILQPNLYDLKGYELVGWFNGDQLFDFDTPITSDITLVAKWNIINYNINYYLDGGINNANNPLTYTVLDEIVLQEPTKEGYVFVGWYKDSYLTSKIEKIELNSNNDFNLYAKWDKMTYTVSFVTDCDTSVSTQVIDYNGKATKPNNLTKEGYRFIGWYLGDEEYNFDSIVTEDLEIVAKWEVRVYIVSFNSNCDVKIDKAYVNHGDKLPYPEELTLEDCDFLGWMKGGQLYDFDQPVTSNFALYAQWEMKEEAVNEHLSSLVPTTTTEDISLTTNIPMCSAEFIWTSSNTDVINEYGKVTRLTKDVKVTLTVLVLYSNKQYELSFDITVTGITLKPLTKGSIVSGYLADYGSFSGIPNKMVEQLDVINYSFAGILNGELYISASLKKDLVLSYREQGVRVVLAVGGWGADGFSQAVRTASSRTKLVDSVMEILKEYQFDGIDIDWEYPTSSAAGIVSHPSDRTNLTLFCQELKAKMVAYRSDLILSIAIAPSNTYYDLKALNEYIDIFNVMTYDFAMGSSAKHDSNLYTTSLSSSSMDNSVKFVMNYVDKDKIVPGAAFYVRNGYFKDASVQTLGATLSIPMSNSPLGYDELVEKIKNDPTIVESYDEAAEAAYIIHNRWFYSYDNPRSIKAKCDYIKANGLGGIMCWELTTDYIDENGVAVLVDTMYQNLK